MLSRRRFAACAICAATGLVATGAAAQQTGGITRTILNTIDYPGDGKHAVLAVVEIAADTVIARHTHPGVESSVVTEGEFTLEIAGQAPRLVRAGEGFQVPPNTVHGGKGGPRPSRLAVTFIVEKDKPLASPA